MRLCPRAPHASLATAQFASILVAFHDVPPAAIAPPIYPIPMPIRVLLYYTTKPPDNHPDCQLHNLHFWFPAPAAGPTMLPCVHMANPKENWMSNPRQLVPQRGYVYGGIPQMQIIFEISYQIRTFNRWVSLEAKWFLSLLASVNWTCQCRLIEIKEHLCKSDLTVRTFRTASCCSTTHRKRCALLRRRSILYVIAFPIFPYLCLLRGFLLGVLRTCGYMPPPPGLVT